MIDEFNSHLDNVSRAFNIATVTGTLLALALIGAIVIVCIQYFKIKRLTALAVKQKHEIDLLHRAVEDQKKSWGMARPFNALPEGRYCFAQKLQGDLLKGLVIFIRLDGEQQVPTPIFSKHWEKNEIPPTDFFDLKRRDGEVIIVPTTMRG